MKFKDIQPADPRWTERESAVFAHLFRQRDLYVDAKRLYEAHGVNKSIWIMGNVLDAFDTPVENRPTDFSPMI